MEQVTAEMIEAGQSVLDETWRETSAYRVQQIYLAMSRASSPAPSELVEAGAKLRKVGDDKLATRREWVEACREWDAALQSTAPAPAQVEVLSADGTIDRAAKRGQGTRLTPEQTLALSQLLAALTPSGTAEGGK